MSKLNPKEVFMVVLVVNILCYYLGFILLVNPLIKIHKSQRETMAEVMAENERVKAEVAANDGYLADIATCRSDRKKIYENCFPEAQAETIHKFFNDKSVKTGNSVTSISIATTSKTSTSETGQEVESIFKDNTVTFVLAGNYKSFIDFLTELENLKRTSFLTTVNISGSGETMSMSGNIDVYTVKKDVEDKIFNYEFTNGTGGTALNMQ
jgi:Tfp pilus assembly protein PilO